MWEWSGAEQEKEKREYMCVRGAKHDGHAGNKWGRWRGGSVVCGSSAVRAIGLGETQKGENDILDDIGEEEEVVGGDAAVGVGALRQEHLEASELGGEGGGRRVREG